jgi:hypothetical protein
MCVLSVRHFKRKGYYTYRILEQKNFWILPTKCIYVFCMTLKINSDVSYTTLTVPSFQLRLCVLSGTQKLISFRTLIKFMIQMAKQIFPVQDTKRFSVTPQYFRHINPNYLFYVHGPRSRRYVRPAAYCETLWWRWRLIFFIFPSNGTPAEWNWQGKTKVLGEKPVLVPLWPPKIPYGLTRDRTWASAATGQWLTAWAMTRPIPAPT